MTSEEFKIICEERIRNLVNTLASDYGIADLPHKLTFDHDSIRGNAGGSFGKCWEMFIGMEGALDDYEDGFVEYKRLQPLLMKHGLLNVCGWRAIDVFVLHEFAHVLTYVYNKLIWTQRGYRYYRNIKAHGAEYKEVYAELLNLYTPREDNDNAII